MVNPMIVEGQVRGGVAQGIAAALYEELAYNEDGQLLNASLMDYLVPTAAEIPPIEILHLETPSAFSETGAKGLGEGGTMGAPACIACAVDRRRRPPRPRGRPHPDHPRAPAQRAARRRRGKEPRMTDVHLVAISVNGDAPRGGRRGPAHARRRPAPRPRLHRHAPRLRARDLRRVHRAGRRRAHPRLPGVRRAGRRLRGRDRRGPRRRRRARTRCSRRSPTTTGCSAGSARPGFLMLADRAAARQPRPQRRGDPRGDGVEPVPLHGLQLDPRRGAGGRAGQAAADAAATGASRDVAVETRDAPARRGRPPAARRRALRRRRRPPGPAVDAGRALAGRARADRGGRHRGAPAAAGRARRAHRRRPRPAAARSRSGSGPTTGARALPAAGARARPRALRRRAGRRRARRGPLRRRGRRRAASRVELEELEPGPRRARRRARELRAVPARAPRLRRRRRRLRARAAHVVEVEVRVGRHSAVPLECRGLARRARARRRRPARCGARRRCPHCNRDVLAGIARRCRPSASCCGASDAGGGFGVRGELYPEDVLVCLLARRARARR